MNKCSALYVFMYVYMYVCMMIGIILYCWQYAPLDVWLIHMYALYTPWHVAPRLCNGLGCVRSVLHISYNVLNCVHRKDTTLKVHIRQTP